MFENVFVMLGLFCGVFLPFMSIVLFMFKQKAKIEETCRQTHEIKKLVYKDMDQDKEYRQYIRNTMDKFEDRSKTQLEICQSHGASMQNQTFAITSMKDTMDDFKIVTENNTAAMHKLSTYLEMLMSKGTN